MSRAVRAKIAREVMALKPTEPSEMEMPTTQRKLRRRLDFEAARLTYDDTQVTRPNSVFLRGRRNREAIVGCGRRIGRPGEDEKKNKQKHGTPRVFTPPESQPSNNEWDVRRRKGVRGYGNGFLASRD